MSNDLENNKIIAALLVAGIVAMLAGFVAKQLVHSAPPAKAALEIDTSALETASSGEAPAGPEPILALLATADTAKGEALAKACVACHSFESGGANKVGPNLYGIVNAPKAHKGDFAYSDVIKEMAGKGEKWTYQNLSAFLWKPAAYAKGTKMSFPGLKKPQDRANVIAYLRTLAGAPAALPSDGEIAAEAPKEEEKIEADAKNAAPEIDNKDAPRKDPGEAAAPKGAVPKNTDTKIKPADKETDAHAPDAADAKSDTK